MNNKVLITVHILKINQTYELFIPINKTVGNILYLLSKAVSELSSGVFLADAGVILCNKMSGDIYDNKVLIKDTDIRNGTELILL